MRSYTCSSIGTGESGNIQIDDVNLWPILNANTARIGNAMKLVIKY